MQPYEISRPVKQTCFIASIPHSGILIPNEAASTFTAEHYSSLIRTDWYIDRLFEFLPSLGFTVLKNHIYRNVIDVNRELREPLFGNVWKSPIPAEVLNSKDRSWDLYRKEPTREDVLNRVEMYYKPYHSALKEEIEKLKQIYDQVYLIDLHSYIGAIKEDICLGNCYGLTCPDEFIDKLYNILNASELEVVKNKVFPGGFITKNYFEGKRVFTLQIEIRSGVFIDESELDQGRPPKLNGQKMAAIGGLFKDALSEMVKNYQLELSEIQ
jgi:N-formylglutamate deformylase